MPAQRKKVNTASEDIIDLKKLAKELGVKFEKADSNATLQAKINNAMLRKMDKETLQRAAKESGANISTKDSKETTIQKLDEVQKGAIVGSLAWLALVRFEIAQAQKRRKNDSYEGDSGKALEERDEKTVEAATASTIVAPMIGGAIGSAIGAIVRATKKKDAKPTKAKTTTVAKKRKTRGKEPGKTVVAKRTKTATGKQKTKRK